ncbi:MAG: DegQ family serine endoprotease [Verrucomicrobia bacterium]|nr:DegQ family serine endoprotease [Verrucomicrobiota bacterium]
MSRFASISFSLVAVTCAAFLSPLHSAADTGTNPPCVCSPQQTSKAFTAVAKKTIPAVVFIKVQSNAPDQDENGYPYGYQNPYDFNGDDFFNRFFGMPGRGGQPQKPQPQLSQGSGFLVSADGYIMTNAHVVKGADKITAVLNDGREIDATLVGSDSHTDIAIVKIEGKDFPFLQMGDSDEIDIGEWVIAIGSPFQLEASVTVGVVSAKGRQNLKITDFEDFIQTDAAINPGNSGGPLINLSSEVIGINTAIVSRSGGYMGIGFAIPSNMAKNIMAQIIDKGSVTRGFLGVSLQPVDKDIADAFNLPKPEGALISEVVKDSPADKAGLKQGDIIIEYNKQPVKSLQSFRNEVSLMSPGSTVSLKVNRKGQMVSIPVTLGTANDTLATSGSIIQKLGMEIDNLTADLSKQLGYTQKEEGVVITKIKPGSAAAMAGLRPGFLIQAVNHQKVSNVDEFNEALGKPENKRILLLVRQGNATRFYSIKVD